jgi:SPP1 gp7 family putative phage head morphogenesis protein
VNKTVKMNLTKMSEKIAQMYLDSGYVGTAYAVKEMGAKASLSYEMAQAAVLFDWDKWTPGSPKAAAMLDGGRFAATMDRLGISLKDVKQTAYDRIGNTIADGVAQGLTAREISSNLADVIDNPDKAMTITVTETNRAFNEAAVDQYSSAGLTQFEWYSYDGACPDCLSETGEHDIGYDVPPAHPNCRCVVLGVVPTDEVPPEE